MTKRTPLFFAVVMTLATSLVIYFLVEATIRALDWPDPDLLHDMRQEMKTAESQEEYFKHDYPAYGWDANAVDLPAEGSQARDDVSKTVLFIGDSVTQGFGVDAKKAAFPALLHSRFGASQNIRLVNAAVQGFGIDQMLMKLEAVASTYNPDVVVFAYIPHDLWRPGRDINYGYTKPILLPNEQMDLQIIAAPDILEYYRSFAQADARYYRSLWALTHVFKNRRYYFPKFYTRYYNNLFQSIRHRLHKFADQHSTAVLVVRLASTWPGRPVSMLDANALEVFEPESNNARFRFFDSGDCVKSESAARELDFAVEFQYHPSIHGHQIYATCLADIVAEMMALTRESQ